MMTIVAALWLSRVTYTRMCVTAMYVANIPYNALFSCMPIFANRSAPLTKEFFVIVFFLRIANIRGHHMCIFAVYNSLQIFTNWILFVKIMKISRP